MAINNLIKYSNNYSNTSGILCQYCRDEPAVNNNGDIVNVVEDNTISSLRIKEKILGQTGDDKTKGVEIMVPLKYPSNFWRAVEMCLINCEINLFLTKSASCVIASTAVAE